MKPRVLVITPTLGDSPWLDATVDSVRGQTAMIRHVVTCPAARVVALRRRFPEVEFVADAGKEGGIYGALNAGLRAGPANWDWFTYINDDDRLLPGLSRMLEQHDEQGSGAAVIYGDVDLIDANGAVISQITTERSPHWIPALLQSGISPLMQQGTLFRREVVERLDGFDLRYRLCADLDFWLRAYVGGARFQYHPLRVAQFRLRGGQLSSATARTEQEQAEIVQRHLPRPEPAWRRRIGPPRYRLMNLPRYVRRIRTRGLRTSYELLRNEPAQS
ncbi:MAG TPA: glycosyltransferase [Opitutaceae bacterium]|nr:glycosyltransferase [Opitutaceae bacterium]